MRGGNDREEEIDLKKRRTEEEGESGIEDRWERKRSGVLEYLGWNINRCIQVPTSIE